MRFRKELREEYKRLFNTCVIRPERLQSVNRVVARMIGNQERYEDVLSIVPWYFTAVIHNMEASGRFDRHLHNGDSLKQRTHRVPAGRPKGDPPFTWEESARDALAMKKFHLKRSWSTPEILYRLERYNGWGYRQYHPHVLSPYLWAGSNHYTRGKYVEDGRWSDTAVSKQIGAAVLLLRVVQMRHHGVEVTHRGLDIVDPEHREQSRVAFSTRRTRFAADLQRWLNTFEGIHVQVDGRPGSGTSAAFKAVTGHYLPGDPRSL